MIISFAGKKRVGKDTAANVLVKKFGFKKLNFADPLKEVCSKAFNLDIDYFYNDNLKDTEFKTPVIIMGGNIATLIDVLQEKGIEVTPESELLLFENSLGLHLKSPRHMLQFIGTDLCRKHISENVWIDLFMNEIRKTEGNITCADARLPNERQAIRELGGINVRVKNNHVESDDSHISENLLGSDEEYQVIMYNDSSKSVFENDIELWFSHRTNFRLAR